MEEEARAPAGCRGVWGPRGWGGCPWRTRAGRRPLLHCRPGLCPAWEAWGKGSVPAPPQEPPCPNDSRSHCRCEEPVSGQQPCQLPLLPAFRLGPGRTLAGILSAPLGQVCPVAWPASSPHPCGGRCALCLVRLPPVGAGVPCALSGCGHCASAHSLATLSTPTPALPPWGCRVAPVSPCTSPRLAPTVPAPPARLEEPLPGPALLPFMPYLLPWPSRPVPPPHSQERADKLIHSQV